MDLPAFVDVASIVAGDSMQTGVSLSGTGNELAVNSRSMLQIMAAFSSYMDVPQEDLDAHRATPLIAFASVSYRNTWFWGRRGREDEARAHRRDVLFTLTQKPGDEQLPLVTIPAQQACVARRAVMGVAPGNALFGVLP
jgi:hypothetical protein